MYPYVPLSDNFFGFIARTIDIYNGFIYEGGPRSIRPDVQMAVVVLKKNHCRGKHQLSKA